MIYLEIIKATDALALGVYEFEFDQITIGRAKKSDLIFFEKNVPMQYLILRFIKEQLVVQSIDRDIFYLVNGKKVSGTLKLKPEDVLSFGEHEIKILKSGVTNQSVDFSDAYETFNAKAPELRFALEFIEQVIIDLEKDPNV